MHHSLPHAYTLWQQIHGYVFAGSGLLGTGLLYFVVRAILNGVADRAWQGFYQWFKRWQASGHEEPKEPAPNPSATALAESLAAKALTESVQGLLGPLQEQIDELKERVKKCEEQRAEQTKQIAALKRRDMRKTRLIRGLQEENEALRREINALKKGAAHGVPV